MTISENDKPELSKTFSRAQPLSSHIIDRQLLTKPGSTKQTYHIELSTKHSTLSYRPGDSIGILSQNDPHLAQKLLSLTCSSKDEEMIDPRSHEKMSSYDFLLHKVNFARVPTSLLKLFLEHSTDHDQKNLLTRLLEKENKELLSQYLHEKDIIDVLSSLTLPKFSVQEIAEHVAPLLPRFYSVASSQRAHPDSIHLTVALFTFSHQGSQRYGVASHFLCNLAHIDSTKIPIYVQPAAHFHLPEDPHANIIMVGPGTGIAPFRAFMQERESLGSRGASWLFFGERTREYDYLYQDFWEKLVRDRKIRLDLAFSSDQKEKVYVQHKLYENAKEIWKALEEGAYFYICGDASHMAKDVEHILLKIFQEQGTLSEEGAKLHLRKLRHDKRLLADVY